jgi:hypothetical protein
MMDNSDQTMHVRRIKLADGRYLIFYTFGDRRSGATSQNPAADHSQSKSSPETERGWRV